MQNTIVIVSTNREMQRVTRDRINQMRRAGAQYVEQVGCSDVALARCMSLTGACNALRMLNAQGDGRSFDTFLMVDDDMQFEIDQAQALINHSRAHVVPASAIYATLQGTIAAQPMTEGEYPVKSAGRQMWRTGLGLLAIPSSLVLTIERRSPKFSLLNGTFSAFTSSAVREDGSWSSEDFTLCEKLGGVHLLPIGVGHLKVVPLYPDEETIASIRNGVPLPKSLTAEELDRLEPNRIARNETGSRG